MIAAKEVCVCVCVCVWVCVCAYVHVDQLTHHLQSYACMRIKWQRCSACTSLSFSAVVVLCDDRLPLLLSAAAVFVCGLFAAGCVVWSQSPDTSFSTTSEKVHKNNFPLRTPWLSYHIYPELVVFCTNCYQTIKLRWHFWLWMLGWNQAVRTRLRRASCRYWYYYSFDIPFKNNKVP